MGTVVLVDIGNSRTKLAISDGHHIYGVTQLKTGSIDTKRLPPHFDLWVLSSVVPEVGKKWVQALSKKAPGLDIRKATNLDIVLDVEAPQEVGSDRIADMEGVFFLGIEVPFITVDFGTATVLNLVDANNRFLGGAIGPGLMSSYHWLTSRAALLRTVRLRKPMALVGRDTRSNLESGFIYGFAYWAKGYYESLLKTYPNLQVIITGGGANLVKTVLDIPHHVVPNLSLMGLMRILELNLPVV
ncbi:type III pantothenate kinase [Coprothermobacteraceae bacterium]|nr:type III pantothenate kinase [Coprothermobacteraceae bacterium]